MELLRARSQPEIVQSKKLAVAASESGSASEGLLILLAAESRDGYSSEPMKACAPLLLVWTIVLPSLAQESMPLWPEGAPHALGKEDKDIPTITPFLPAPSRASGAAIVICPGGGYGGLAPHEGKDYALFLAEHGIACFTLKYRLGSHGYRHPQMLEDAARAVRLVRARASQWNVDPKRVGIMGSSAGGHLASTLLTHFDGGKPDAVDPVERQSSRPDLGILCYAIPIRTL
jgi:acetyl esterase/lipase